MPSGTSARARRGDVGEELRVGLEAVLVEVLVAHDARTASVKVPVRCAAA